MTPDIKFLIAALDLALEKGEFNRPINYMTVGKTINLRESGINNTVKLLTKANFVTQIFDTELITLTERGRKLALEMRNK